MATIQRLIGWLAFAGVAVAAASVLASLALIGYSVVMRYFLNAPAPWVDELVGYLLVVSVMLGAGDALRKGEHISVDILTERLGARGKRASLAIGLVAVALTAGVLTWQGWATVAFSRMAGIISNEYLAVPIWIPQLAVPIGAAILFLAAVATLIGVLRGDPEATPGGGHGAAQGSERERT